MSTKFTAPDGGEIQMLAHEYINTGGHCMCSIFEVFNIKENATRFVLVGDESCALTTVDYLGNDYEPADFDDVTIAMAEWGEIEEGDDYFELFQHCYFEYLKRDCMNDRYEANVRFELLPKELQLTIPIVELATRDPNMYKTDGFKITEYFN